MNAVRIRVVGAAIAIGTSGCATGPDMPLIFGASNTWGVSVGASAREQGADFIIGYKGQDFAVVPVTAKKPDGAEVQLSGDVGSGTFKDAYSVFGQFKADSTSSTSSPKNSIGKFFATGAAAKRLADGYAMKIGNHNPKGSGCAPPSGGNDAAAAPKTDTEKQLAALMSAHAALQQSQAEFGNKQLALQKEQKELQDRQAKSVVEVVQRPAGASPDIGRGKNMYFAQYSSLGFVFSASPAQEGADLTLGWKDRNLAVVPVVMRDAVGNPEAIRSKVYSERPPGRDPYDFDAYSVLGQFEFTQTPEGNAALNVGLGKFFTTGQAAKRLGDGFATKLCDEYVQPGQQGKAGAATGAAEAGKAK